MILAHRKVLQISFFKIAFTARLVVRFLKIFKKNPSDKVHENGHNLRKMRPRTKIKPVLETRDPGLSAGYQKIQKRPSFCVEI